MSIAPVFALGKKLTCAPPFFSKPRKSFLRSVLNITLLIYIAITMLEEIKGYLKGMRGITQNSLPRSIRRPFNWGLPSSIALCAQPKANLTGVFELKWVKRYALDKISLYSGIIIAVIFDRPLL